MSEHETLVNHCIDIYGAAYVWQGQILNPIQLMWAVSDNNQCYYQGKKIDNVKKLVTKIGNIPKI